MVLLCCRFVDDKLWAWGGGRSIFVVF